MAETVVYSRYYRYQPEMFATRLLDAIFGLIEGMLALRLMLIFFNANPASSFVAWAYAVTDKLVGPFQGAFPSLWIIGFPIDIPTILAMIAYAVIGWLLIRFVSFIFSTTAY